MKIILIPQLSSAVEPLVIALCFWCQVSEPLSCLVVFLNPCPRIQVRIYKSIPHRDKQLLEWLCCAVHSVVSNSLRPHGLQPARLLCPWGFSRPEQWSGLPCLPPGDLPNPGIEPGLHIAGGFFTVWAARVAQEY